MRNTPSAVSSEGATGPGKVRLLAASFRAIAMVARVGYRLSALDSDGCSSQTPTLTGIGFPASRVVSDRFVSFEVVCAFRNPSSYT